jgi:hypothetical protein
MILRIEQDSETVAEVDNYAGPVPRVGEYIWHNNGRNVMQVKAVTWGIIGPRYEAQMSPHVTITV